jgi:hypothetical protein
MSDAKRERIEQLLVDRALEGLSAEETAELSSLMEGAEDSTFDFAAAAADVATQPRAEPLPEHLAKKIEASALSAISAAHATRSARLARTTGPARRQDIVRYGGWLAAAACLAIAAASWCARPSATRVAATAAPPAPAPTVTASAPPVAAPPAPVSPAEQREQLLAASGSIKVNWSATKDPMGRGVSGDVVWNGAEQRGTMRFHGLAANDPSKSQYQLWIFDPSQDKKTPIDGGVFDVDSTTGDVVVAIHAKLRVTRPSLFAVTVEKPGGVVVSKREHIVVVAPVKG